MCVLLVSHRGVDHWQQGMPLKNRPRANSVFWKRCRAFVRVGCDAVAAIAIRIAERNWSRCYHHSGGLLRLCGREPGQGRGWRLIDNYAGIVLLHWLMLGLCIVHAAAAATAVLLHHRWRLLLCALMGFSGSDRRGSGQHCQS